MFRICLLVFCCYWLSPMVFGQKEQKQRTEKKDSKWPYFGSVVPRYLALAGGYEGFKTNNFQLGLMLNAFHLDVSPSVGALIGGGLFYKQHTANSKVFSYEAELGMYGGLVLGFNYSYNHTSFSTVNGFKPFAGIAVYNAQLFYGYCFYETKSDPANELRHNRITLRYVIPVSKIKRRQRPLSQK